mgnify:CR=1 FL=1
MKSVRLDPALEARLEEAARVTGESVSRIIREAIEARCDQLVEARLDHRLADVIGVVSSTGDRARRTGRAFVAALKARAGRRRS